MNLTGRAPYVKGQKPEKVKAIRDASMAAECTLQIPGVCCHDPSRVVGCHLRLFSMAGAAQKPDDLFLIDACDRCHDVLDRRDKWEWADAALGWDDVLHALMKSQARRRAAGLIHLGRKP